MLFANYQYRQMPYETSAQYSCKHTESLQKGNIKILCSFKAPQRYLECLISDNEQYSPSSEFSHLHHIQNSRTWTD